MRSWTFDLIDMDTATADERLGAIFERCRYRWHVTRRDKVSPNSKRWYRRWCGNHGVRIRTLTVSDV